MKKVFLSFKSTTLGYLCKDKMGFCFYADETKIKKVQKKYPILMKMYTLNVSGAEIYARLPNLFANFLPSKERVDLITKAGIIDSEDEFEKLYKLAGLKIININFKIHR